MEVMQPGSAEDSVIRICLSWYMDLRVPQGSNVCRPLSRFLPCDQGGRAGGGSHQWTGIACCAYACLL